jgi:hypothetical protein
VILLWELGIEARYNKIEAVIDEDKTQIRMSLKHEHGAENG